VGFRCGSAGVDHDDTLWLPSGNGQIGMAHTAEEGAVLPLKAVFVTLSAAIIDSSSPVAAAGAFHAGGDFRIHKNGQFRQQVAANYMVQRKHWFAAQLAAAALVSFGGVGEAIAKHHAAFGEGGLDDFLDVLRARSKHQRQLGQRRKAGSGCIKQKLANFLSGGRTAGLARYHHRYAVRAEHAGQPLDLRALAAAVEPFEGDEPAALRVGRHAEIIAEAG